MLDKACAHHPSRLEQLSYRGRLCSNWKLVPFQVYLTIAPPVGPWTENRWEMHLSLSIKLKPKSWVLCIALLCLFLISFWSLEFHPSPGVGPCWGDGVQSGRVKASPLLPKILHTRWSHSPPCHNGALRSEIAHTQRKLRNPYGGKSCRRLRRNPYRGRVA